MKSLFPLLLSFCFLVNSDYDHSAREAIQKAIQLEQYEIAYNKALNENKPLLIWVNLVCPKCEKEMSWAVHAHLNELGSDPSSRVLLGMRDKKGVLVSVKIFFHIPTVKEVTDAVLAFNKAEYQSPPQTRQYYSPPPQYYQPFSSPPCNG